MASTRAIVESFNVRYDSNDKKDHNTTRKKNVAVKGNEDVNIA